MDMAERDPSNLCGENPQLGIQLARALEHCNDLS
jgi:hypothetical protein